MAEDEDGVSKKSSQNSNNEGPSQENEATTSKPDLGIGDAKRNTNENGEASPSEARSSSSKSSGTTRKEENPFSFRHFLKRDLSLPGNSTYENTGARPKVYANTVQHSPTEPDVSSERRDRALASQHRTKDSSNAEDTPSSTSVEIPFSAVDDSDSKRNLYVDGSDVPFFQRPNLASEPLGMPSLPDFVQDHILVEQAYLNSNGPISVDFDNLPDFTFNTNYNANCSSSSSGRRNNGEYVGDRSYNYEEYMGEASASNGAPPSGCVPLDLPVGAQAAGPAPLDLPVHLSLDLTESVNPADRRNMSPRSTFPLDLPPNAGAESMRLPDFLPVHPGRTSPEPEHQDEQMRQLLAELERTRSELFAERTRRSRAERDLATAREELGAARARLQAARRAERQFAGQLDAAAGRVEGALADTATRATDAESIVANLKNEIKNLKEELSSAQAEAASLRARQAGAAGGLRRATAAAGASLRELLAGLEQLNTLSSQLDPT